MALTKHYSADRSKREALIQQIGEGTIVAVFTVDRGHRNGAEIHAITDNGIIIIRNKSSRKLVTKLIARPGQVKRYFKEVTPKVQSIINIAKEHEALGYNFA